MNRNPLAARILAIASILSIAVGGGCKSPTQPSQVPLGQSFELRAGASAMLAGGLTISFLHVRSDSRCPMDAMCVWAGDAILMMSLAQSSGSQEERELHTNPTGSEVVYRSYSIKLEQLAPYPRSNQQIRPEDYVATLVVRAQ